MELGGSRNWSRLASPRGRRDSQLPPLKPLKNVQMVDPKERMFLEAAEKGDRATLAACLHCEDAVNVNCTDLLGRSAIEIAVDNENVEIVELLLLQPTIRVGNALLCAIREGVYRLVEMLINHPSITPEMLGEGWTKALDPAEAASAEYSSDISPVILAAHLNQFEILQLLLSRNVTIKKPHDLSCSCAHCLEEREMDSLHHSLRRIHTFRALASPAWISLTSPDPILTAFKLSWELFQLSYKECEFKEVYVRLSEQCKTFACDLLSQCRSTEEVIAVLNREEKCDGHQPTMLRTDRISLDRLKLAIDFDQRQFVSHPHCQQLLTSIWYEGFPGRQERGSVTNIFVCLLLIIMWPLAASCYIFFPKTRIGQIVRSPFMKFLYYSSSFGCFLFLLTAATFEEYRLHKGNNVTRADGTVESMRAFDRGPPPTLVETLILIWVLGMVWTEVKQLWEEGYIKYLRQSWNWLDFIMMSLYLCTIGVRMSAYYRVHLVGVDVPYRSRMDWPGGDPMLLAEGLFAVANVFSFARIIYLFQTNLYLGPLQISLGCMLMDIAKFCFIFFLILSSFSIGLAQLYWYYDPSTKDVNCLEGQCRSNPDAFASIANAFTTLIWSLFSITKTEDTDTIEDHQFTQGIGKGMFVAYHVVSIIILLNMLIAMMSHSFQIINDNADMEWKFHRTKLWMSFFDEGSSLAAPFNIIITPKSVYYFLRAIYRFVMQCLGLGRFNSRMVNKRPTIKRPGMKHRELRKFSSSGSAQPPEVAQMDKLTYEDIMRRLVARFIHQTKKDMKMDGVSEDDLLEIKQDISSLRYELREDRRIDHRQQFTQMDKVKHDIMRTLSQTSILNKKKHMTPILHITPAHDGEDVQIDEEEEDETVDEPVDDQADQDTSHDSSPYDDGSKSMPDMDIDVCSSSRSAPPTVSWQDDCKAKPVQSVRPSSIRVQTPALHNMDDHGPHHHQVEPGSAPCIGGRAACNCCCCRRSYDEMRKAVTDTIRNELQSHFVAQTPPAHTASPPPATVEQVAEIDANALTAPLLRNGRLFDTHMYTQC